MNTSIRKRPRQVLHDAEEEDVPAAKASILTLLRGRESGLPKKGFTKAAQRTHRLSFTDLETPTTEAVLGMDHSGSYLIAVEVMSDRLSLIRRAVPSNAPRRIRSAVVQRIPLGLHAQDTISAFNIEILLAHPIGVVRIIQEEEETGNLWIYSEEHSEVAICPNVRFGQTKEPCKLLWNVSSLPIVLQDEETWYSCQIQKVVGAHLLLNDEDDGYRLTWITCPNSSAGKIDTLVPAVATAKTSTRDDIITTDSSWIGGGESIVYKEAYLNVEVVLDVIRAKRPNMFLYGKHTPRYAYDLVSISGTGRYANFVICFTNKLDSSSKHQSKRPPALAVHIKLCLFSKVFEELSWEQTQNGSIWLEWWSAQLAYTRRLKELALGPYCCNTQSKSKRLDSLLWKTELDVGTMTTSCNSNTSDWRSYSNQVLQQVKPRQPPCFIPSSYLYQDCLEVTNEPVRKGVSVLRLDCPSGYTELVYNL